METKEVNPRVEAMNRARAEKRLASEQTHAVAKQIPQERGSRKAIPVSEEDKIYEFEMIDSYESVKPVDKRTGKPIGSPYPPYKVLPNEGVSFDEDYVDENGTPNPRSRQWRYIEGQPSIWVDEQVSLANLDKEQINTLLGETHNQLILEKGKLMVRGIEKLKLQALKCMDAFEGKKRQYRPQKRTFRLLNPDAIVADQSVLKKKSFDALKLAYESTVPEMLEACFVMGINIDDQSESGLKRIQLEFIKRAEYDPKNPGGVDWFTGIVRNPLTHVTYVFAQGLAQGIISAEQQPGKLTWAKPNTAICDIPAAVNVADWLTSRFMDDNQLVIKLCETIEGQLE